MHGYTYRSHEKSAREERTEREERIKRAERRSDALDNMMAGGGSNSELIEELRGELRDRSNEIRNTELDARLPENGKERGEAEQVIAARSDDESADDRMRCDAVKAAAVGSMAERDRTVLVGMEETAQSSVRRMEYLERERDTKERVAAERLPVTAVDADRFDFLLLRRSSDEEEAAEDLHKEDNV